MPFVKIATARNGIS